MRQDRNDLEKGELWITPPPDPALLKAYGGLGVVGGVGARGRPGAVAHEGMEDEDEEDGEETGWLLASGRTLSAPHFTVGPTVGVPGDSSARVKAGDELASQALPIGHRQWRDVVDGHFCVCVAGLLKTEGLEVGQPGDPESWLEVVRRLSVEASRMVRLDSNLEGGEMDPGGYVKVKCIATGKRSDRYERCTPGHR